MRLKGSNAMPATDWAFGAARFAETPITFADRQHGSSKIDGKEAASALKVIFSLGVRNWLGRK